MCFKLIRLSSSYVSNCFWCRVFCSLSWTASWCFFFGDYSSIWILLGGEIRTTFCWNISERTWRWMISDLVFELSKVLHGLNSSLDDKHSRTTTLNENVSAELCQTFIARLMAVDNSHEWAESPQNQQIMLTRLWTANQSSSSPKRWQQMRLKWNACLRVCALT